MDREDPLTIGELAARTGVPAATLRSWEQRFGFPTPGRSAGGQRRYAEHQVDQVRRVQAERSRGLALGAAIALAERPEPEPARSVFADLRAAHPHVDVMVLSARMMLALTYAIEDECLARAVRPLVLGCFQTEASFHRTGGRWHELARRAQRAVVLADFASSDPSSAPQRAALPPDSPLLNEWGLVCEDEGVTVALVGWERPRPDPRQRRTFEALISEEPAVVRDAAVRYARAAEQAGLPATAELVPVRAARDAASASMSLLRRFAAYADHQGTVASSPRGARSVVRPDSAARSGGAISGTRSSTDMEATGSTSST